MLCYYAMCHNTESHILSTIMLTVVMLTVVILSAIAPKCQLTKELQPRNLSMGVLADGDYKTQEIVATWQTR
jgi:hypothetical protein